MRKELFRVALTSALITWLALIPVGYVLYRHLPPRIATVDVQKLVEENQRQTLNVIGKGGALTDTQRTLVNQQTVDFAKKLSNTLNALGQTCHCALINQAALLAGTTLDYTDWVREELKR